MRFQLALAVALGVCLLAGVGATHAEEDAEQDGAWQHLEAARASLGAEALEADFVQTYVPAGFSSGDEEHGRLLLSLPGCLRWDYDEPYPRRYLLCGQTVWAWSPGETRGDRFLSVSRAEAGLDFLLLSVDRLRERYEASLGEIEETSSRAGAVAIDLTARTDDAPFVRATIFVDLQSGRPVGLGYSDRDGNQTRFDFSDYRPLEGEDVFLPPSEVDWIDG